MPEGDTLFRAAATLRKALLGESVTQFDSTVPLVSIIAQQRVISGRKIAAVEARGKHLLVVFRLLDPADPVLEEKIVVPPALDLELLRGDMVLHTHLRMTGSWHIYRPGETWKKPTRLAKAVIHSTSYVVPCFNAPVVELLTAREAARHPQLATLGPDAMTDGFDRDAAFQRLRSRPEIPVGVGLMNQRNIAGVGNVYKSEVLFIMRTSPFVNIGSLSDDQLYGIVDESHKLLQLNETRGIRQTRFTLNSRVRLWAYGRGGQPCLVCGTAIQMRRQGLDGRSTYYCSHCQHVDLSTPSFEA